METPIRQHQSRPTPPGGVRLVTASDGSSWVLREVEREFGGSVSRVLVCGGASTIWTVRNYPPDWLEWAEVDLLGLVTDEAPDAP